MAPEDSVHSDASTVHRTGDPVADAPSDGSADSRVKTDPIADAAQLESADTVIRAASQDAAVGPRSDRMNRTPVSVAKVLIGQHLNHFELEELIGGGGMGAVFRAHDEQLDREVAIKVIPFAGDAPDLQRRFRNEAQSAAKLDHPRIARVFDVGHQDDWYYIVFEYVRGTNIRDLVSGAGEFSVDDAVFYTCQVAEALQHASERGVVHRDIKPSNVLVDKNRDVKLVDMGLARTEKMEVSQQDLTASGMTLGTFDYISPEQAKDPRAADLRSDIYSLGCTLYFMLTAQPPYPGGTMLQKLLSHGNSPPPDARLLRNGVSYELSAIIQKMLAKHPEQRYQTGTDLIADLRELAFREGLSRSQGVNAVAIRRPNLLGRWVERNSPWLVTGTLLLLSTGWLKLNSGTASDGFVLERSPNAKTLRATSEIDLNPVADVEQRVAPASVPVSPVGPGIEAETSSDGERASDPPTLQNVPVPDELMDPVTPEIAPINVPEASVETAIVNSPTEVMDPVDGDRVDPSAERDLVPAVTEFPRLVRVVGAEEIIDPSIDQIQDDVATTTSLSEALKLSELYDIDRIEISAAVVYSEPVTIRRDDLSIASTVKGGTKIIFESPPTLAMSRPRMISLGTHGIQIEDLHLVWEVPRGELDGGSLIATNESRSISITNSSLTIRNQSEIGDVYAIEVVTGPSSKSAGTQNASAGAARGDDRNASSSGDAESLPLVAIQLTNVIVRGQMTMISMDYAAALRLQWENGLLAISERMIETSGARSQPSETSSPMRLSLNRLTAAVPMGVLHMQLTDQGSYPVVIDRESRNSVYIVDKGVPHVSVSGLVSTDNEPSVLELRGEANVYVVDTQQDPILSLTDINGQTDTTQLADLTSPATTWSDEKSPGWNVWWSSIRSSELTCDQYVPSDFHQYGAVLRGFDEKSLPVIPGDGDTFDLDTEEAEASSIESR